MHMHVETLRTHTLASMRMLAFRNLNFHYFDSLSPISLSNGNSYVLLSSFCRSCPLSQERVVLVTFLLGIRPRLTT